MTHKTELRKEYKGTVRVYIYIYIYIYIYNIYTYIQQRTDKKQNNRKSTNKIKMNHKNEQ